MASAHGAILGAASGRRLRTVLRPALYIVAAWLAVGLLSASQYYFAARSLGRPGNWGAQLLRELPAWQIWSLLTPLAFALARRHPLVPGRLLHALPVHAAASAACALVYLGAYASWMQITGQSYANQTFGALFIAMFQGRLNMGIILYWALVGVHHAKWNFHRLREREVEAARIQSESARARADAADALAGLARARLQALRSQLHPHFLFNTLHSIASLMDEDVATARRLIARLSDLLRTTFEIGEASEVRLGHEIEFLERYLDIERVRYGARLDVRWTIPPETRGALLPPLLLQPLVENAIRHGIAPLEEGGAVRIAASRVGEWLWLEVADTGGGFEPAPAGHSGSGLRITRERLEHTYGGAHEFRLETAEPKGLVARIRIPFRTDRMNAFLPSAAGGA